MNVQKKKHMKATSFWLDLDSYSEFQKKYPKLLGIFCRKCVQLALTDEKFLPDVLFACSKE